jgi:hypothetical protein
MGKDKPRYDFYENNMFLDDPMAADLTRKGRCAAPKIGTEPRVSCFHVLIEIRWLEATLRQCQDLNTCQEQSQSSKFTLNTLLVSEEVVV